LDRFRTVIFDCDSTLSTIEGIEELAHGRRAEVEALTEAAMRGSVRLEEVYGRRLELTQPSRAAVERLGQQYVATLVEDAREVVSGLRAEGIGVRVISAGLLPAVLRVTRELGIADDAVAAVDVRFDTNGSYAGYERGSPLTGSGGKRRVLNAWVEAGLPRPLMMVGDGVTDLEVKTQVDLFVAFAGVVERPAVIAGADVTLRSASLAPILPLALAGERPRDPIARSCYEKGMRLLGGELPRLNDRKREVDDHG
jgi:phosphoserine phosphatase